MLILLMGVELAKESLNKILHPALVEFSWLVIGILAASICAKLYMAMYNRSLGKKISAPALLAAAADSLGDCMSTSAVLIATLIGHYFQLPVDGWALPRTPSTPCWESPPRRNLSRRSRIW